MATALSDNNPYKLGFTLVRDGQVVGLNRYPLKITQEVIDQSEIYTVKSQDTLTRIAYKKYNDPQDWWVIADYNGIKEPWDLSGVDTLIIPPPELAKKFIDK